MASRTPTSIRLSDAETELVAAWADYLAHETGMLVGVTAVFRVLLKRSKPPASQGAEQSRIRRAYAALYGAEQ